MLELVVMDRLYFFDSIDEAPLSAIGVILQALFSWVELLTNT